jgi:hypothetical protein
MAVRPTTIKSAGTTLFASRSERVPLALTSLASFIANTAPQNTHYPIATLKEAETRMTELLSMLPLSKRVVY